ncbi:MAG: PAS domain-containing protein [Oscillatoriales cyanobacterium C42_A2020_001]|nr:PAS domain-containing protein [Leptolyngbyaceae cyanobacterium C42_A2020_001]
MVNICDTLRFTNPFLPSSQRLTAALKRFQVGATSLRSSVVYVYDLVEQQTLYSSGSVVALLGFNPIDVERLAELGLAMLIHPDDLQSISDYFQQLVTLQEGEVMAIDYRMQRADRTWCWLRSQETLLVQAENEVPLQVLGLIQDLTPKFTAKLEKHLIDDRDFEPYESHFLKTKSPTQ